MGRSIAVGKNQDSPKVYPTVKNEAGSDNGIEGIARHF